MKSIIAILNQKGGVGKTTTTVNVGAYLAQQGRSVLLIDFDPQGNATSGLGIDVSTLNETIADVIGSQLDIKKIIVKTKIDNLFIAPSDSKLASSEIELASSEKREFALKTALAGSQKYDYILIDCPPSLGLLTVNALSAADSILIPVQSEYYAMEGLSQLLQVMQQVRKGLNPELELLGVLLTMYDKRNRLSEQVYNEISKHFGDKLFSSIIPRNVRLAEAPSYGMPISEYDKRSKGAKAYKNTAKEVIKRSEKN